MREAVPDDEAARGIVLAQPNGDRILLDRYARNAHVIPAIAQGSDEKLQDDRIRHRLAELHDNPPPETPLPLEIHVVASLPLDGHLLAALERIVGDWPDREPCRINVHFEAILGDWEPILTQLLDSEQLRGRVTFLGQILRFSEMHADLALEAGVRFSEVAGWWPGCAVEETCRVDAERIDQITWYGIRLPVLWYVHRANLECVLEAIESASAANHYSGFALQPVCTSAFFTGEDSEPEPPPAEMFCQVLVDAYCRYSSFDDDFEPLVSLMRSVRWGGWHPHLDFALPIRMLVRPDGMYSLFRQIPALASDWNRLDDILALPDGEVVARLRQEAHHHNNTQSASACGPCQWRYLCGGLDRSPSAGRTEESVGATICAYRQLFCEFFVRELRTRDCQDENGSADANSQ